MALACARLEIFGQALVHAAQRAQFWLDAAGAPQYSMVQTARDAFASWNDDRDSAEDRVAANRYVSPEMTGAGDLDRYGRWEQTTDYGPVWQPTVVRDKGEGDRRVRLKPQSGAIERVSGPSLASVRSAETS